MASRKHTVELTGEQIAFLQTSLDHSAQRLRDYPYEGEDPAWVADRHRQQDELIASIPRALREGVG